MRRGVAAAFVAATLVFTAVPAQAHTSSPREVKSSAYRGKFYDPRYENVRKCIVHRESRGHYGVVNSRSGAAGAYQFMPTLRRYAAQKMKKPWLANVPFNRWSRKKQDRAFWVVWNHGRGRSHWAGGSWRCW